MTGQSRSTSRCWPVFGRSAAQFKRGKCNDIEVVTDLVALHDEIRLEAQDLRQRWHPQQPAIDTHLFDLDRGLPAQLPQACFDAVERPEQGDRRGRGTHTGHPSTRGLDRLDHVRVPLGQVGEDVVVVEGGAMPGVEGGCAATANPSPQRREMAAQFGADMTVDSHADGDAVEAWKSCATENQRLFVYEASGARGILGELMYRVPAHSSIYVVGSGMVDETVRPAVGIYKNLSIQFCGGPGKDQDYRTSRGRLRGGSRQHVHVQRRARVDEPVEPVPG